VPAAIFVESVYLYFNLKEESTFRNNSFLNESEESNIKRQKFFEDANWILIQISIGLQQLHRYSLPTKAIILSINYKDLAYSVSHLAPLTAFHSAPLRFSPRPTLFLTPPHSAFHPAPLCFSPHPTPLFTPPYSVSHPTPLCFSPLYCILHTVHSLFRI